MLKRCGFCKDYILDQDDVVAVVVAKFHSIPSTRSFSITQPTACIDVQHMKCAKQDWWEELDGLEDD